jgi:hypothetical protein
VTELLDLALKAEHLGRFAEAREWLRRAIALDGGRPMADKLARIIYAMLKTRG